jgi:hypothetical protein
MYFNSSTALVGLGLLIVTEVSRSHTHAYTHTTLNSTPLDEGSDRRKYTTLTQDRHPRPRRDSNPQSQQASNLKTHVLDHVAIGIGLSNICYQLTARRTVLLENHNVLR